MPASLSPIVLPGPPSADGQAATKGYGDGTFARTQTPTAVKTANYTAALSEIVMVDASGGPVTITLPPIVGQARVSVKKVDSSTNAVTVAAGTASGGGAQTVGSAGAASIPVRTMDQVTTFQGNGTNWVIPYNHLSLSVLDSRYPATANVAGASRAVTANTTAVAGERLAVDATGGARTISQPVSPTDGARLFVSKTDTSANTVTLAWTISGDTGGVVLGAQGAGVTVAYSAASTAWTVESTTTAVGKTGSGSAPASAGARSGTYDPRTNIYMPSGRANRLLRANLTKAAAAATPAWTQQLVDIVCLGDSRTAGYYTGATPTDSWPSMLRARLTAAGYPSAGTGLVMASNNSTAIDSRIALAGSWTAQYPYRAWGASGSTATFTSDVAISSAVVEVYYYSNSGGFTVKVGAGTAQAASPAGGTTVQKHTMTGQTIAVGTQIVVTSTSASGFLIGFCVRATTGVLVHSVAWGGISSTTVATTGAITLQGITAAINPSILGVMIGCNDSGSTPAISAATHAANLTTITTTNNPNAAKFLICESPNPTYEGGWPGFVQAQYDRADTLNCPLLDLNDRYGSSSLAQTAGLLGSDGVHETVLGGQDLARAVTTLLAT